MSSRQIFVEVTKSQTSPQTRPRAVGAIDARNLASRQATQLWLGILFALVVATLVAGGATRLADAGLVITEWGVVSGAIPVLSDEDWQASFMAYQQTSEFQLQKSTLTLAQFKTLYWLEWGHRQAARLTGVVWFSGLVLLLWRRLVPPGWLPRLILPGALGALQGGIGWWMVRSGLEGGMVDVAGYRLAAHLGLAFIILALLAWYILLLGRSAHALMQSRRHRNAGLVGWGTVLTGLVFVQVVVGGLVAGIDAGANFTDWPLMAGQLLPPDPFALQPLMRNLAENPALVQFLHRMVGYILFLSACVMWFRSRRMANHNQRRCGHAVAILALLQMVLGVATLLAGAPPMMAMAHQFMALLLWISVITLRFQATYPAEQMVER